MYAALMKLYIRVRRTDMAATAAGELSTAQHSVVRLLAECDGMRITDMARAERVSVPTMSVAVHRLMKRGYVRRSVAASDARAAVVQLTTKGRAASSASATVTRCTLESWLTALDGDERRALSDAVRILDSLAASERCPTGWSPGDRTTAAATAGRPNRA
ncbi:hypothetical protein AU194_16280 [Mycobacterium sp. GA-2829]|nr:hypothetical protein AU194_16280 [Mycobacterium sp. GA-2829]